MIEQIIPEKTQNLAVLNRLDRKFSQVTEEKLNVAEVVLVRYLLIRDVFRLDRLEVSQLACLDKEDLVRVVSFFEYHFLGLRPQRPQVAQHRCDELQRLVLEELVLPDEGLVHQVVELGGELLGQVGDHVVPFFADLALVVLEVGLDPLVEVLAQVVLFGDVLQHQDLGLELRLALLDLPDDRGDRADRVGVEEDPAQHDEDAVEPLDAVDWQDVAVADRGESGDRPVEAGQVLGPEGGVVDAVGHDPVLPVVRDLRHEEPQAGEHVHDPDEDQEEVQQPLDAHGNLAEALEALEELVFVLQELHDPHQFCYLYQSVQLGQPPEP